MRHPLVRQHGKSNYITEVRVPENRWYIVLDGKGLRIFRE